MTSLDINLALRFAAALGLGILLGLERQRTHDDNLSFAGVRTVALVALLGAATAYVQSELNLPWLLIAAFGAVAALALASLITARCGALGITTELTVLLTFLLGALCVWGQIGLAAAVGVASLLLLTLKDWLHRLAHRIETADVEATLKFAVITLIILPLLPNHNYGPPPLDVINPYKIWLMVVLISGLNFASYILVKIVGQEHGIGLTGILGGLVSSTAVTVGFSQRSRNEAPPVIPTLALGILLAWTVMLFRVLAATAVVNAALAQRLGIGVGLMAAANLGACTFLWWRTRSQAKGTVKSGHNPFELGEAIKFGLLFGTITFAAKAAEEHLGSAGLYLTGALAGLTDVDAISLSMANLTLSNPDSVGLAARTVLIAILANTIIKSGMIFFMAATSLRRQFLPFAALMVAAGGTALFLIR